MALMSHFFYIIDNTWGIILSGKGLYLEKWYPRGLSCRFLGFVISIK